jgi:hypothetical protein
MPRKNSVGDGGSAAQKRALGALPDAVRATKKSSTPVVLTRPLRRVQLTKTRPPRIGIWLKGKKAMLCAQPRHTVDVVEYSSVWRCEAHWRRYSS